MSERLQFPQPGAAFRKIGNAINRCQNFGKMGTRTIPSIRSALREPAFKNMLEIDACLFGILNRNLRHRRGAHQ